LSERTEEGRKPDLLRLYDVIPRLGKMSRATGHEGGDTRASAGMGLLYYTGIGPIRVDVAAPLNPRRGDKPVAVYVSIGQSF
jgi:outer membrane protein assembly factor BamA